jgi:soluble lytic murein transglycosylase-like protein
MSHEQEARAAAEAHGLDPALVCAVVHNESGWDQWALRYEPGFYRRYIEPLAGVGDTEKQSRAFSYGLMQIMGQTAREFGFGGKFLVELCDPVQNLEFGCRKLAQCMDRAGGNITQALLLYNGGGDKAYPDRVLRYVGRYK